MYCSLKTASQCSAASQICLMWHVRAQLHRIVLLFDPKCFVPASSVLLCLCSMRIGQGGRPVSHDDSGKPEHVIGEGMGTLGGVRPFKTMSLALT
jgi:hypothetical protein